MTVELNHTIVAATDRDRTADFLVDILGLGPATTYGPFQVVALANGVSLDVVGSDGPVHPRHYAFQGRGPVDRETGGGDVRRSGPRRLGVSLIRRWT